MKIVKPEETQILEPLEPKYVPHFQGKTTLRDMHRNPEPYPVSVLLVRFEAGSRNNWHYHTGGQMLYVTEGEGYVQTRGQPPQLIRAGDIVNCPPNEDHWHGASPDKPMAHLAVTIGETVWRGEPSVLDLPRKS